MNNFVLVFDRNFQLLLGNNYNDDSTNKKNSSLGSSKNLFPEYKLLFPLNCEIKIKDAKK